MSNRGIFWGLMLLDISFQVLHFGGLTFFDQWVHAGVLALATVMLIARGRIHKVGKKIWFPVCLLLLTAMVQLLPLPKPLLELLNPWKADLIRQVSAVFPIQIGLQPISFLPDYERVRLASWFLDAWFFGLVLMGPRLSRKVLNYWVGALSFVVGSLLLMIASGKLTDSVSQVLGGPGNENQTAGFLVYMSALGLGVVMREIHKWRSAIRSHPYRRFPILAAALIGIVLNVMALFTQGSRSGFLMMALLFLALPMWWLIHTEKNKWAYVGTAVIGLLGLGLTFNISAEKLASKIDRQGFYDQSRVLVNRIGLDYLKHPALFGQGLGSSAALIGYRFPTGPISDLEFTEFHNDWLQILVEMGLPGLVVIGFLGYWLLLLLKHAYETSSQSDGFFLFSVAIVLVLVGLQSLVTFPLRITGIRLFLLLILALALRMPNVKYEPSSNRWIPVLLALVCVGAFLFLDRDRLDYWRDPNPVIARGARYGTLHQIPLFQATEAVKNLLDPVPRASDPLFTWRQAHALAIKALETHLTSLRAMNLIFQLDVLKSGSVLTREKFDQFKQKAEWIETFGNPKNQNAVLARMLLYQAYPTLTTSEEKSELQEMEKAYRYRMNRAEKILSQ